ncbi:hypothetical protein GCM10028785_02680 [Hydrogenophaga soli]
MSDATNAVPNKAKPTTPKASTAARKNEWFISSAAAKANALGRVGCWAGSDMVGQGGLFVFGLQFRAAQAQQKTR